MKGIIFAVFWFCVLTVKAEFKDTQLGMERSQLKSIQEFKNVLEKAKKIVGFCELYSKEFSTLVKSCSKYSDRAVAAMQSVTSETCESLRAAITQFESFTQGADCHQSNPNVYYSLEENLKRLKQTVSTVGMKIAQYQASLANEERVPLTGAISREILIVWAMEVTPKYAACPIQTLGESDQVFYGQSNDATKIYFRWKQGLMCSNQLEAAVLAREATAKTKVERERITEIKKMMQNESLALELTESGLQTTNTRVSWLGWLNARTHELMNRGRAELSEEAQRSWTEQSQRTCLSNLSLFFNRTLESLIEETQAQAPGILELCN